MPFTGSHPAAVVPLQRLGVPASALVIGSLAPDLPYFLPTPFTGAETHSLASVFSADLFLGLVAFLVWHLVLVPPLQWAAPEGVQRRIPARLRGGLAPRLGSAADLGRVSVGVALGALTHVAWDSFTHAGRWGQRNLPWLNTAALGHPAYWWLQLVSSVAGLAVLAWLANRWWHRARAVGPADPISPLLRWGLAGLVVGWASISTAELALRMVAAPGRTSREALVFHTLIQFFSTLATGLLIAAVVWHLAAALRTGQRAHDEDPATRR